MNSPPRVFQVTCSMLAIALYKISSHINHHPGGFPLNVQSSQLGPPVGSQAHLDFFENPAWGINGGLCAFVAFVHPAKVRHTLLEFLNSPGPRRGRRRGFNTSRDCVIGAIASSALRCSDWRKHSLTCAD